MRQNTFETKQRTEELMHEALSIWQASDQSDFLTGLEDDPVFNVIMSALAYQANDFDNQIAKLKTDILEEFEKTLSTGAVGNAVPTSTVVRVNAQGSTPVTIDENTPFHCQEAEATFLPLLKSRVFNIQHYEVERLDGRRWKVGIDLPEPVSSLEGMTFAIAELPFHDLHVSLMTDDEQELPLNVIAPWESYNMPLTEPFSLDTLMYNRTRGVTGGGEKGNLSSYQCNCAMDIFAQQGLSLYYIGVQTDELPQLATSKHIDLCFEFDGLGQSFIFNESQVAFNVVLLANVAIKTTTLSSQSPIAKLAGGDEEDFLYLLRPDSNQVLASVPIDIRRVHTDRFNRSSLISLLNTLIDRFHTDKYAFMNSEVVAYETHVQRIVDSLRQMQTEASKDGTPGESVYLQFNSQANLSSFNNLSLNIRYLVTKGDSINKSFSQKSKFTVPGLLDERICTQIIPPHYGHNAIRSEKEENIMRRYLLTTNDRLVTPYDIQLFCRNEIQTRYNIDCGMIEHVTVQHERLDQGRYHTYMILVTVTLVDNSFVHRAFDNRTQTVEKYLEKMIQVRTTGIYPVKVVLKVKG